MCGIGGILRTDGQPIPEEWLDAIDARIAWRGPDGQGRFRDRVEVTDENGEKRTIEVAFVHRRLSIIDHEGGKQPMVSQRGRDEKEGLVAVVFNGCIYNHRELRRELEGNGHRFVTDHSDTEVLIHGWREWRETLIDHLEGMYALAIWDRTTATLAVARDSFGEKPLFITSERDVALWHSERGIRTFIFASDAQSVGDLADAAIPAHPDEIDVNPLEDLFRFGYLDLGLSRSGGCRFNPEHKNYMVRHSFSTGRGVGRILDFFDSDFWYVPGKVSAKEWCHTQGTDLESLLDTAVCRRLEADVPLGCFLSGGVDSSLIAFFAKRQKADLRTFSVRMPDPRYDESMHSETVASVIQSQHTTLEVCPRPAEDLVHLIGLLGQPFGDSSILPTYWVSKAARAHVKVALSGDGGDEFFVGYERYFAARPLRRFWWLLTLIPSFAFYAAHPKSHLAKLARLGDAARDYRRVGLAALEVLFRPADADVLIGNRISRRMYVPLEPDEPMTQLRNFDVLRYLPNDLLRKVDIASMACGLEVRCPFLDRDLARAALSMPIDQLIPGGQRKGLLRQIARKYLPKEIVDRPKMGFAIPIGEWFRSDYGGMKTLLLDHLNSAEPFGPISLNRKAVQKFIDEHMSGKRDHGQRLFTLLTLSIWARGLKDR